MTSSAYVFRAEVTNMRPAKEFRAARTSFRHLNVLNVQLQGPDQLLHSMFSKIKSFTSMLSFWES